MTVSVGRGPDQPCDYLSFSQGIRAGRSFSVGRLDFA